MSKAFQCDNCGELFTGDPPLKIDNKDICHRCEKVLKSLGLLDPFEQKNLLYRCPICGATIIKERGSCCPNCGH